MRLILIILCVSATVTNAEELSNQEITRAFIAKEETSRARCMAAANAAGEPLKQQINMAVQYGNKAEGERLAREVIIKPVAACEAASAM
ncbi:MAG: hypothetical protein P4L87_20630 [Formivibrio sp.]|nr:hypothetical protein [Formivibrio sp.]